MLHALCGQVVDKWVPLMTLLLVDCGEAEGCQARADDAEEQPEQHLGENWNLEVSGDLRGFL